jgi:hypothetical protein
MSDLLDGLDLLSRLFDAAIRYFRAAESYRMNRRAWKVLRMSNESRRELDSVIEPALTFITNNEPSLRLLQLEPQTLRDRLAEIRLMLNGTWVKAHLRVRESQLQAMVSEVVHAKMKALIGASGESLNLKGYAPADDIRLNHGILATRLSEGKKERKIRFKPAPPEWTDSQGKPVRILYHVDDARRYAEPKRTRKVPASVLKRRP